MSTLALMRWLESAPARYERGMRWLTLGRVDAIRTALADAVTGGDGSGPREILEIGCGTGALTDRLLARGASVTAIDQSPEMLEIARARHETRDRCRLLERTASEIDALPDASFDAVVAAFSFSEMSASERRFVLEKAREKLRAGGRLAIADEVRPRGWLARLGFAMLRAPQSLLAWLAVGSVSHPISDFAGEIEAAGFAPPRRHDWLGGHLALFVAERTG